ncbi:MULTISPECIES: uroporphyrinogen-III synthase [Bacillaceae]|uniref:uroporphyrinogen-III synthase n=1 Tax=Bacillaceae TaxID=186817 RepID=UPI000BA69907|nr:MULTISPECIES: uroporphyrinogen-III synthase [Bacillaceae]PAE26595.1 uroporphyrinogen-III synthase [Bacillus sp. 7894-2]URM31489.1 uroporphyrinogen-III synthase [Cytobacillus firmus]
MKKLAGKKVALLGSRKIDDISKLVENQGGIAVSRPAQGTALLKDEKLQDHVEMLTECNFDWIIFTTGIGVETIYQTALEMNKSDALISSLKKARIASRGYKTANMLKKLNIIPAVRDDDGSMAGLLRELSAHSLDGMKVALQLHGDPAPHLKQWLENNQADYEEILPYTHIPPEEKVMNLLLSEILDGKFDSIFFTSTPQVRNLFSFARQKNAEVQLKTCFSDQAVALSVGKVTAQALHEEGVARVIFPEVERIGSAVIELARFYAEEDIRTDV